jgi:DNA polymerase-1
LARLFLIDGYALIYRAFYALLARPLRTTRGENTSAAWGVANFLLRLRERYTPEYLVWVNDAGDSGRGERFPQYKSTREKLDETMQADFDLALEQIEELLRALRIPVVMLQGWEADDVIGTLATAAAAAGIEAVIVSGDKDLYQLIGPRISLLNPGRGGPSGIEEQWVDASTAAERLGVPPERVVDFLALVGDSSDNVPGVKGIGEKGARQLLEAFGDLDTLLARAEEVPHRRAREALLAQADQARLSRELVTIRRDAPIGLELDRFRLGEPDRETLAQVLTRLEFHSLAQRLLGSSPARSAAAAGPPPAAGVPEVVDDAGALNELAATLRAAPPVLLRAWVTDGDPRQIGLVGLGLSAGGRCWYLPFAHRALSGELGAPPPPRNLPPLGAAALAPIAHLLSDAAVPKVTHDAKREWEALRGAGVELRGLSEDTMLASFLLDPGRRTHDLHTLALDRLGRPLRSRAELLGKARAAVTAAEVDVYEAAVQCRAELDALRDLLPLCAERLAQDGMDSLYREIELPLVQVLVDMEWTGIAIDADLFATLSRDLGSALEQLRRRISETAGVEFNPNSPKQMAAVLFEKLQLPVLKRTKTGASTDADVLEQLAAMGYEVPALILQHRELEKLRSTYVDALPGRINPGTGRIHTTFNQTGAATGRISSSDPNLQNIPVRSERGEAIRRGFVPAPGHRFVAADYSQIELRLLAHFSGDPAFLAAFRSGGDIHRQTAALIFDVPLEQVTSEMRARAKTINFATIYGQSPFALSRQLGISQDEARQFIAQYFDRFAGVRAWLDRQVELARARGWVETLFHRRRYVPELGDRNHNIRAFGERLAQNSPLQGSAADLIKVAMIRVHRALATEGLRARLVLQVHDELLLEAPLHEVEHVCDLVRRCMEGAASLDVPLVVDIGVGDNWRDAKKA